MFCLRCGDRVRKMSRREGPPPRLWGGRSPDRAAAARPAAAVTVVAPRAYTCEQHRPHAEALADGACHGRGTPFIGTAHGLVRPQAASALELGAGGSEPSGTGGRNVVVWNGARQRKSGRVHPAPIAATEPPPLLSIRLCHAAASTVTSARHGAGPWQRRRQHSRTTHAHRDGSRCSRCCQHFDICWQQGPGVSCCRARASMLCCRPPAARKNSRAG